MGLLVAVAAAMAMAPAQQAQAHGYIKSVKSRAYMCSEQGGRLNTNCGNVQYEPQSVEYTPNVPHQYKPCTGTFKECGPADGWIASGGLDQFSELNEQTATRWAKSDIRHGANDFTWYYTAGHPIAYTEFYITRQGWNPNAPLSRDSFELEPIAHFDGHNENPGSGNEKTYSVNIPADHVGYHVILAAWKVGDTAATFYQAVDVNVQDDGAVPSRWTDLGTVPAGPLKKGSKVTTRVFTAQGEQPQRNRVLNIDSDAMGQQHIWPMALATLVPASDGYRIGVLNGADEVVPGPDGNHIYAGPGSDVTQVIVEKQPPAVPGEIGITGLSDSYPITDGRVTLFYSAVVTGERKFTVFTNVINSKGQTIAFDQGAEGDNQPHFTVALEHAQPGAYDVVVRATSKDEGQQVIQATRRIVLLGPPAGGGYDYVFPEGLGQYGAGTKVLAKDGAVYQCKEWPNDGYCKQWSSINDAYEPGVGRAWSMAWDKL